MLALLLLSHFAPSAQLTDTVQADADTLINPWTFFQRRNPGGLAYYFAREVKQGYPDQPAHWGWQNFPSRDSVLRMYPRHRPIAIAHLSTAPLEQVLRPFAKQDLVQQQEGFRVTFVDNDWVVVTQLKPPAGATVPGGHWQRLRVLEINGGHKMIGLGAYGYLLPMRDGRWQYFYNTYPTPFTLQPRVDSIVQYLGRYTYPDALPLHRSSGRGLQTLSGRELVPARYDTVYENGYYLVAQRSNTTHLYYRNGEPHTLHNVRALRSNRWSTSALLDTGTVWLDLYGKPTPKTPYYIAGCGFQAYHREERLVHEPAGWVQYSSYRRAGSNDTATSRTVLSTDPQLHSLQFITLQSTFTDWGMDKPYRWPHDVYVATFRDSTRAVVRFDAGTMQLLTRRAAQQFRIVGDGILRFDAIDGVGLYPYHQEPHYATLEEFDKGFAKFTLAYGSTGHVTVEGVEYGRE